MLRIPLLPDSPHPHTQSRVRVRVTLMVRVRLRDRVPFSLTPRTPAL